MTLQELMAGVADNLAAKIAAAGAGIGVVVGMLRGLIEQKYGSVSAWIGAMAAAMLVGVLVHLGLHDVAMASTMKVAITCGAAFVADDALRGLRALGQMIGADPIGAVRRIAAALRGGHGETAASPAAAATPPVCEPPTPSAPSPVANQDGK